VQLSIATRHGHLSEASQEKLKAKAEKLSRIFDRLTSIQMTVDLKDPHNPKVDLNVSAEHKHDFVAHEQSDNLLAAVDAVISKVEQQLRKYKEKVQQKHREPDAKRQASASESVAASQPLEEQAESD
jgi:putative sigma-54 modulation protein